MPLTEHQLSNLYLPKLLFWLQDLLQKQNLSHCALQNSSEQFVFAHVHKPLIIVIKK